MQIAPYVSASKNCVGMVSTFYFPSLAAICLHLAQVQSVIWAVPVLAMVLRISRYTALRTQEGAVRSFEADGATLVEGT